MEIHFRERRERAKNLYLKEMNKKRAKEGKIILI